MTRVRARQVGVGSPGVPSGAVRQRPMLVPRAPKLLRHALWFCGVLGGLMVVGVALGGVEIYGQAVREVAGGMASSVTGVEWQFRDAPTGGLDGVFGFHYVHLAAVVALFLATRRAHLGRRATVAGIAGLLAFLLHAVEFAPALVAASEYVAGGGVTEFTAPGGVNVNTAGWFRALQTCIPLALWPAWFFYERRGEAAASVRSTPGNDFERWRAQHQRS